MSENRSQGRERRSSVRKAISLAAELVLGERVTVRARLEDFCAEGVYATFAQESLSEIEAAGVAVGSQVHLRFTTRNPTRLHDLYVEVRRIVSGGLGGMFVGDNSKAIGALIENCGSAPLSSASAGDGLQTRSLVLRRCEKLLVQHLAPLMDSYLTRLPEAFDEEIQNASTDTKRTKLVDARIVLKSQLGIFKNQFLRLISDDVLARAQSERDGGSARQGELSYENLTLVDKQVFEDWLTIKVMITKAETAYRDHLLQLTMRLDALGLRSSRGYSNPLGPPLICHALRDTLMQLHLAASAERVCLRLFEEQVMTQLEDLYEDLNGAMIRAGVLPNLNVSQYFSKPKNPAVSRDSQSPPASQTPAVAPRPAPEGASKTRPPAAAGSSPGASQKTAPVLAAAGQATATGPSENTALPSALRSDLSAAEASVRAAQYLFGLLKSGQNWQGMVRQRSQFPAETEAPAYSNQEVLENLREVQTIPLTFSAETGVIDRTTLRDRMHQLLTQREETLKALSGTQDQALEVVDRFFASVLKNPKITDTAKTQIKGLELPVLKLVMRDPAFFRNADAIPRQVINRIAQLGMKSGRTPKAFTDRINQHVARIQAEYDNDPSVFEDVLGDLDSMLERQNLLYRRNVERVAAAAEGQQKIALAKDAVRNALDKRLSGKRVPKAVLTLVNGGWRDLLSLCYIRLGTESREWSEHLQVIDELLRYADDRDYALNLPEILRMIQEGLSSISSNQIPSGHIRDELKQFLTSRDGSEIEWVAVETEEDTPVDPSIRQVQDSRRKSLQRWLVRAQRLQPGDWLRLDRENTDPDFVRLVWVGEDHSRYVFVNHQGMKVIDLDAYTLAAYLQKGIAIVEVEPERTLVDESLDEMVKGLYEQLNFVSTHDELTGLMQRKEFERQIALYLDAEGGQSAVSLILVSLSQFRFVNDSQGLEAGDKALKDIARILRAFVGDDRHLCRFGGDEFLMRCESPAASPADQIHRALDQYRLKWRSQSVDVKACIGYVDAPAGTRDVKELIMTAETAVRAARARAPDAIEGHSLDENLQARREAIASQVAQLDRRQADEKILLRSQKIIPLHSKTRMGTQYEILLSVYDSQGNLIPAADFVRAAEDYQRMQMVDRWVVGHVLDWMKDNKRQIEAMGGVCINLSGHSLNDEKLLEFIFERLTQYDVPLDKICFEITEAAAITNTHDIAEFIQELQEYGCRFCLGHFGSGISYQLLKRLPVDMIKVDGTYMREIDKDSNDRMMVRSMTEMAHYLGREIIAPFVESQEIMDTVQGLGVDYVQGYHIERPKSLTNF